MPGIPPWDEKEPVTNALRRWGLYDAFYRFVSERKTEEAANLLVYVGVDRETAEQIIAATIGLTDDKPPAE